MFQYLLEISQDSHFVLFLGAADAGEEEVGEEVEGHEGHQEPVGLRAGQLSFRQIHSVENSNDAQDLG